MESTDYSQYLPDLDNYHDFDPTTDCYLDGRYFNLLFAEYPGLITKPLKINLKKYEEQNKKTYSKSISLDLDMDHFDYHTDYPNILRVIIETDYMRHSGVVIFENKDDQKSGVYFDCSNNNDENKMLTISMIKSILSLDYLELLSTCIKLETNKNCDKSGFCVAYSIKFIYDFLNGYDFDPSEIRKFATCIQTLFGKLDSKNVDKEYGVQSDTLAGVGIGGVIGGVLGGPIGLVAGGALGGVIGNDYARGR